MACNPAEQIEHVEFDRRMTQQMDDVTESLCVLQTKSVPAVADGPVLALFAEDSGLHGTEARLCIGGASRAIPSSTRLRCHVNFSRPFGQFSGETELPRIVPSAASRAHTNCDRTFHI